MPDHRLATAERHVQEGCRIVERQHEIIANRKAHGLDTSAAEDLLASFEHTLVMFERDLQAIAEWATLASRA